ncbi:ABC transporter ATP-binding protein [Alkalimonas sp. MEB108]|uniref:ABC transporter ATP-binding protein n=1 Tax=Alkalimonas cellulosilytica TaxID=3058395 RepID=A0ABU7J7Q6_9GAMM|nr:ABC transporter ATP-binding protein [Alkalimonas sp. MEB108]MEE2002566.1 ABC transporter ATP-binding protein [Alkalimonas sp. MEB108]
MSHYIVEVENLNKAYKSGHQALKDVNLQIKQGEILALLGPNGAGKTTLISIICGLVNPGSGSVRVAGFDVIKDYRQSRQRIGLVPQELVVSMFETVWNSVVFSRGMFGKARNDAYLQSVLQSLSLWEKRDSKVMELSGGMKRRLLIAKALAHEPEVLFLDEPTAGVDVELRRDMWRLVEQLRQQGVTIILTTHYIEEAEEIADRIGIISRGEVLLVEEKQQLMTRLGQKQLMLQLQQPLPQVPDSLAAYQLDLSEDGLMLTYTYDGGSDHNHVTEMLGAIERARLELKDVHTKQRTLEQIFVSLLEEAL